MIFVLYLKCYYLNINAMPINKEAMVDNLSMNRKHFLTTVGKICAGSCVCAAMGGFNSLMAQDSTKSDSTQKPAEKPRSEVRMEFATKWIRRFMTVLDENLDEEVNMYGEMWKNGSTLTILVTHQIHHRGQLTVLMRQAGLKVPGFYGPAREEWTAYGMPAQK